LSLGPNGLIREEEVEASMKSILIACLMIMFTLGAAAQTLPNAPKLSTDNMPIATPTMPQGTAPSSGTSLPGAAQTSNPIDQAKTEAECKIPTNAAKPECVELMLKK
jgi:hypothetical protein